MKLSYQVDTTVGLFAAVLMSAVCSFVYNLVSVVCSARSTFTICMGSQPSLNARATLPGCSLFLPLCFATRQASHKHLCFCVLCLLLGHPQSGGRGRPAVGLTTEAPPNPHSGPCSPALSWHLLPRCFHLPLYCPQLKGPSVSCPGLALLGLLLMVTQESGLLACLTLVRDWALPPCAMSPYGDRGAPRARTARLAQ